MMVGTANATMTQITAAGALDEYDNPTTGQVLWDGNAAGYLRRTARNTLSGGQQAIVKTDVFWLLSSAGAPVLEQIGGDWEGTTVTIRDERTAPSVVRVFRVLGVENRVAGTPVDNLRLELGTPASNTSTG